MNNYKKIILDNGIPLYLNSDKNLKQVYFGYYIGYGSNGKWFDFNLNGKDYHVLPGYAHFLEHLLGERSKHGNIYKKFYKERFYDVNAYTSQYHTYYHFLGVDDVKESIKEMIEAIDDPVFDLDDVIKTRHAIEEEASMTTDDYNIIVVNLATNNLYKGYNAFYDTLTSIGDRETTKNIDIDTLKACYEAFYRDDNKKIVISGNIDEKEIVDFLNNIYKKLPKHNSKVILLNNDYDSVRTQESNIFRDVKTDIDAIGFKIKKPEQLTKKDVSICIDILLEYIHGSESEFSISLKEKRLLDVLKFSISHWNEDYLECIHSFISEKSDEYYKTIIDKINRKDITREEYEIIRKTIIADEVRELDNKYNSPSHFGYRIQFTEDYSDIDYFTKLDYDRFKEIYNSLDFSNHTKASVKKLVNKRKDY